MGGSRGSDAEVEVVIDVGPPGQQRPVRALAIAMLVEQAEIDRQNAVRVAAYQRWAERARR